VAEVGLTAWHRFTGKSEGGFRCSDPSRLKALWQELQGKEVEVCVRVARRNRSLPQNAIIHVLAEQIAEESGHSKLEIKRLATLEALGAEAGLILFQWQGKTLTDVRGTSELNTTEASAVVDVLIRQAEGLGIVPRNAEHVEVMP
jgi:hypothetical protein